MSINTAIFLFSLAVHIVFKFFSKIISSKQDATEFDLTAYYELALEKPLIFEYKNKAMCVFNRGITLLIAILLITYIASEIKIVMDSAIVLYLLSIAINILNWKHRSLIKSRLRTILNSEKLSLDELAFANKWQFVLIMKPLFHAFGLFGFLLEQGYLLFKLPSKSNVASKNSEVE
jgi:CRISPR/Cas system-associated protein Csx1